MTKLASCRNDDVFVDRVVIHYHERIVDPHNPQISVWVDSSRDYEWRPNYKWSRKVFVACLPLDILDLSEVEDIEEWQDEYQRRFNVRIDHVETVAGFKRRMFGELRESVLLAKVLDRLGGDQEIITEFANTDPDSNWDRSTHCNRTTLSNILADLYGDRRYVEDHHMLALRSIKQVGEMYGDMYDCDPMVWFGTVEEREKVESERRRQELEGAARDIAQSHKITVNSLEFIEVVERKLREIDYAQEEWNNPEVRMEEWAAHMYAGSREAYFDDHNFENGRYESRRDQLDGILEWLSENCPLLWAQHEERKLANPNYLDGDEDEEMEDVG